MKNYINKSKLLLTSIIIGALYIILSNFLPEFILMIMRIAFVIITVMYIYLIFNSDYNKSNFKIYTITLGVLIVLISISVVKIYVIEDLILDESYNVKDNLYYDMDNVKEGRIDSLVELDYDKDNDVGLARGNDFDYKVYTKIGVEMGIENDYIYEMYDKISNGDYTYYIMKNGIRYGSLFTIAKVDANGNLLKLSNVDVSDETVSFKLIESDTNELYYYSSSCFLFDHTYYIDCYDFEVGVIDEDGKIDKKFEINDHRIKQSLISDDELYFLGSTGENIEDEETGEYINNIENYLYKYSLNGKLISKEKIGDGESYGFDFNYDMYLNNDGIYILYADYCSEKYECVEAEAMLKEYDLDLNMKSTVLFRHDFIGTEKHNIDEGLLIGNGGESFAGIYGTGFRVSKKEDIYDIETYTVKFQLEKLDNNLYIKYDNHKIVSNDKNTGFNYVRINENIMFLIASIILYPLAVIDLTMKKRFDKKKMRSNN